MNIKLELTLPSDAASVPTARHICRNALLELGVETGCAADIETAVSEACTNVLKHAESTVSDYLVQVDIDLTTCSIRVIDRGQGFHHMGADGAGGQAIPEGGRGIQLMNALVDRVSFESDPDGGTAVHLYKRLTSSSA